MALLSRIGRAWAGLIARDGTSSSGGLPLLQGLRSAAGTQISSFSSMANSVTFASVTIRSKDVARCSPRLMSAEGARSEKPILNHPVAKLFRRPNEWQTWFEFATQMHASFLLRGNAYAAILRNWRDKPIGLIPLNPDAVFVLEAPDGSLFYQVARYGFFQTAVLSGLPQRIPEADIFHLRALSFNMLSGLSTIGLARDSIGVALGLEQQAARFIANGARPSGVLKIAKTLTKETADRLRSQWEAWRSGIDNVGKTAILEEGLEYQALQLTSVDLEFMAQRKFSIEDVARFWGMPLHKLAVAGEVGKLKIDQADQEYVNTTIMPDLDIWEQKFAQKFNLDDEGIVADFDERRLLRAEEATRINNQRLQVMSGLKTQNECRALEGDPPMQGGDELLRPVNLAASGSDMTGTAPDGAGRPQDGNLPDPGAANADASKRGLSDSDIDDLADRIFKRLARYSEDQPRAPNGEFGSGGGGSSEKPSGSAKAAAAVAEAKSFLSADKAKEIIGKAVEKVVTTAKDHETQKALLAGAVTFVMYHGLQMDMPPDVEEAVRDQVHSFSVNAKVAIGQARDAMRAAVGGLISLRETQMADRNRRADEDEDAVLQTLRAMAVALDKDELFAHLGE